MNENDPDATITRLEELIWVLREENDALREEIRRIRRDQHESPPHYR